MKLTLRTLGLVFAGGAIGTLVRYASSFNLDDFSSLAIVNIVGSAILGWLNCDPRFASDGKRAFWAVGFTGGFTTMSGIALLTSKGFVLMVGSSTSIADFFAPGPLLFFGQIYAIFAGCLLAYWGAHALTERLTGNDAVVSHEVEEVTE